MNLQYSFYIFFVLFFLFIIRLLFGDTQSNSIVFFSSLLTCCTLIMICQLTPIIKWHIFRLLKDYLWLLSLSCCHQHGQLYFLCVDLLVYLTMFFIGYLQNSIWISFHSFFLLLPDLLAWWCMFIVFIFVTSAFQLVLYLSQFIDSVP